MKHIKSFIKNKNCVSVIVSIIVVLVVSVIIVVPIYVYLTGMPKKTGPITLTIDCKYYNDTKILKLTHLNGDPIYDAITLDEVNGNSWNNMAVRINDLLTGPNAVGKANITEIPNQQNFTKGDSFNLVFIGDDIETNDVVTIYYTARGGQKIKEYTIKIS